MPDTKKLLKILFENEDLVAIHKPHGLLVHQTPLAKDAAEFAVQILRDQIGMHVYPAHRLDRKTSGVLLFAKNREANSSLQQLFRERKVEKQYRAIVRGFTESSFTIDYALKKGDKEQEAKTKGRLIAKFEIDIPSGKFDTSRYSLVELTPLTGRHHQLRKHMAHILHPIIGDRPHGCNKQNRLWKERFGMTSMMLHASRLTFDYAHDQVDISCEDSVAFASSLTLLKSKDISIEKHH
jgi:tRNA pseudouridine65 synthase